MRTRLTYNELQELLEDPSEDNRAQLAWQVAEQIDAPELNDSERQIAFEILRTMAKDAAVLVRRALSESLKSASDLPGDIAMDLARDVEAVALPLLEQGSCFSDAELVSLVRGGSEKKQIAIAGRNDVSASVSEALVDTGSNVVVAELVRNQSANIPEVLMHRVVDEFGDDATVNSPLALRGDASAAISERLVTLVSEEIRTRMISDGKIDKKRAEQLVAESRERATVDLAHRLNQGRDIHNLVKQLHVNGRLTPSVIVRAACTGEMRFFEEAMACMAGIEYEKAWVLIHDQGSLGFKALFERTRLPKEVYTPCRIAINTYHDLEDQLDNDHDEEFARKMSQLVLTQYEDLEGEDLDFLMNRLASEGVTAASGAPRLDAAERIAEAS